MMLPRLIVRGRAATMLLTVGLLFAGSVVHSSVNAAAQERGPVQRTVHGKVTDKGGAALSGAVVYLEDQRTQAVKSAIADQDGSYHFVQLAQNTDYLVWAKKDGKRSANKTISSFDSRNEFTMNLKID